MDKLTPDQLTAIQVALIMALHGTAEQQAEARKFFASLIYIPSRRLS